MAAAALRRTDGGYWILGLRKPDPALIPGVPLSRDDTGAAQLDRLRGAGLTVTQLPALTDVDTATEAAAVAELAPGGRLAETVHHRVAPARDPLGESRQSGGFS